MHLLFLDESGSLDAGKGLFALGGIVVSDSEWPTLRALWQETLSAHQWPLDREVKWHGIRKGEVPDALADAVFVALATAPISCYVAVLNLDTGPAEFPPPDYDYFATAEDIYATALMFLADSEERADLRPFSMGRAGIEPATLGLKVPCSTN